MHAIQYICTEKFLQRFRTFNSLSKRRPHAMQIIREQGWQGLYQGIPASLLGTAVSQVVTQACMLKFIHACLRRDLRLLLSHSTDTSSDHLLRLYMQAVYFYFYSLLRKFFVARLQRLKQTKSQVQPAC